MNKNNKQLFNIADIRHEIIYESDRKPGHNAWISLWHANDGRIFISFQEMNGDRNQKPSYDFMKVESRADYDIRQKYYSSSDNGRNWNFESASELFFPNLCSVTMKKTLPFGKILGVYASRNIPGYGEKGVMIVVSSSDNFRTRNIETVIKHPEYSSLIPASMKYFSEKMIILAAYTNAGDCIGFISRDEGKNWDESFLIAKAQGNLSFWEPAIEKIADDSLLCIMRTHREDIPKHNGINYHKVILTLKDRQFTASEPNDTGFGFRGKPDILKSSSGILILTAPGGFFSFSLNDGETWEVNLNIMKGIPHNADPTLLELPENKIFCGYFIGTDNPFPPPVDQYIASTTFKIKY